MVTVDQVVRARDALLLTETYIEGQRILLLADPVNEPLLPSHLSALASLNALDQQLTNIRGVSALVTSTKSVSPWTAGILPLPGSDQDFVRDTSKSTRVVRARYVDAVAHHTGFFSVGKMVERVVAHLAESEIDAAVEVAEEFKLSPIVETPEQEKRLRQAVKIVQRRNSENGGSEKRKRRSRRRERSPELAPPPSAPPGTGFVPIERRQCFRCYQFGHMGRDCPVAASAAATGGNLRRSNS
ncbi:hypothetical protein CYMTET_6273 [Cymbomonas tetramitiformis]|uniref:CCHC-type domain-containing protein n=1 Tax=Cymbomonas tetramitiformis TaxID=36881 RepID=A0AAE0LIK6_9CHLO|nr:hypothetical protein CYMTET_6273 [Cymbomonas tetramitiformis]